MKNKWGNYAIKDGKVKSSYIREYCNRKKIRKARETSDCDSFLQSRKEQKEEIANLIHPNGASMTSAMPMDHIDKLDTCQEKTEDQMKKQTMKDKKDESKGMKVEVKKEIRKEKKKK